LNSGVKWRRARRFFFGDFAFDIRHSWRIVAPVGVSTKRGEDHTRTYEDGQNSHDSQWEQGDNFSAHLSLSATKLFDKDLVARKEWWEDDGTNFGGDARNGSLETVDLFFSHTHGNAPNDTAEWEMWDTGEAAQSKNMRLGDDRLGLSVLATVSCQVLKWDAFTVTRWEPVFMGTLRIALGSHDTFPCSEHEYWTAAKFADRMHEGWSIKASWHSGMGWSEGEADSAALVTGTNETHCFDRLDHMTWYNLDTYKRLGNGPRAEDIINCWCISRVANG